MLVMNIGKITEYCIGIISSPRHPTAFFGFWKSNYNLPGKFRSDLMPDPNHPNFESKNRQLEAYLKRNLGTGSTYQERGNIQYLKMGHTALYTRIKGKVEEPVVGFFPIDTLYQDVRAFFGYKATSTWHNDNWMLQDKASASMEIQVNTNLGTKFHNFLQDTLAQRTNTPFRYQTRQRLPVKGAGDQGHSRNCVAAAMYNLDTFLENNKMALVPFKFRYWRRYLQNAVTNMFQTLNSRGYLQGKMHEAIMTGTLLLNPENRKALEAEFRLYKEREKREMMRARSR